MNNPANILSALAAMAIVFFTTSVLAADIDGTCRIAVHKVQSADSTIR
jgi:hypothetical protein